MTWFLLDETWNDRRGVDDDGVDVDGAKVEAAPAATLQNPFLPVVVVAAPLAREEANLDLNISFLG